MPEIVPTILTDSEAEFVARLKSVEHLVDLVHIDVADGLFVPNKSFGDLSVIKNYPWVCKFVLHLMVQSPEAMLGEYIATGATQLIIHFESTKRLNWALQELRRHGISGAVALTLETPLEQVVPYLEEVDMVLIMGGQPGFNGAPFDLKALDRIKALRGLWQSGKIGVDIGIHEDTLPKIVAAGADVLMVGSEIAQAADVAAKIQRLTTLANGI